MAGIQLRFRSQEKFDVRRDRHCEIVRPWAPIGAKNAYIHNIHFISTNTSTLSDMRRMTDTGSWQNLKENILKLNHRTSLRYFNKKWRRLKNKESYRGPGSVSLVGLEDKWITSLSTKHYNSWTWTTGSMFHFLLKCQLRHCYKLLTACACESLCKNLSNSTGFLSPWYKNANLYFSWLSQNIGLFCERYTVYMHVFMKDSVNQ